MSLLVLTGCGTSTTPTAVDTSGLTKYSWIGFSIKTPASWEQVDVTKVSAPIRGKFELAMRSLINKRGFMNNIVILSEPMVTETSSWEYARQSMLWASREYLSTTIVSDEAMKFDDGTTSQLGIFRAKYNEITEEHLFFQTARFVEKLFILSHSVWVMIPIQLRMTSTGKYWQALLVP